MKLIYVAGAYRGRTIRDTIVNIRKAEAVAIEIWKSDCAALCPHLNTRLMDGICKDDIFLDGTMEMLRRCDGIALVDGWSLSVGAKAEILEAVKLGIPFYRRREDGKYRPVGVRK